MLNTFLQKGALSACIIENFIVRSIVEQIKRIKVTDIMQKEHGSQVRCAYKIKDVLAGQS